jgi:ferritin
MISKKTQSALNKQINFEFYSSYLYLSMSAYFQAQNLQGFANWMQRQAAEEVQHAMKIYDYISTRGGRVELQAIAKPQTDWDSPLDAFEHTYKHEQDVSKSYNELLDSLASENDHATNIFLQWFVNEQVEEEASVVGVLEKLKLIKNAPGGLFMIDRELAQRPPSQQQ